jgi:hypothetical protein
MTKSRSKRWMINTANMRYMRNTYSLGQKGRGHLEELGRDGRITLNKS